MQDLHFSYLNKDGTVSQRLLSTWIDHPTFIFGYCELNGGPKSYSKTRIVEWHDIPIGVFHPYQSEEPALREARQRPADILFTGFPSADRAELEAAAKAAGLVVRKVVTNGLTVLVAGPTAGWAKLQKARELGSAIISRDDCPGLFAHGELP